MAKEGSVLSGKEDNSSEEVDLDDAVADLLGDDPPQDDDDSTDEDEDQSVDDLDDDNDADDDDGEEDQVDTDDQDDEDKDPVQDLIDTAYQGNKAAFVKGIREQWKAGAETAKRLERLEDLLSRQSAKPEPEPPEPDLSQYDEELQELQEDWNSNNTERDSLLSDISKLSRDEAKLSGKLEELEALDDDNPRRVQITSVQNQIHSIQRDISSKGDRYKSIERDQKKLERQGRAVQRKRAEEADRQKKQFKESRRSEKESVQNAQAQVDEAIDSLLERYKIPEDLQPRLGRTIKSEVINYLAAQPDDQGPADLERVTSEVGGSFLDVFKKATKTTLNKGSQDKLKASRRTNTKTPTSGKRPVKDSTPKRNSPQKDWTKAANKARAEAAKLLGW